MCGFLKRSCLGLQQCLPLTESLLVFADKSYGYLYLCYWNPGLGGQVWGWDSSFPRYLSLILIHHTWVHMGPVCYTSLTLLPDWMDVVSLIP